MLKKIKKITNGLRHQLNFKKFLLCKKVIFKNNLLMGKTSTRGGRSKSKPSRITVFNRGGGLKTSIRNVKFDSKKNFSIIISILYDPRRTAFISFCYNFLSSKFYYSLMTENVYPGALVFSYDVFPELRLGTTLFIKNVPPGSIIHNLTFSEKYPVYSKASGAFCILLQKTFFCYKVKLPSGVIKSFSYDFTCDLGAVVNAFNNITVVGKAGRNRLKGFRPCVRGVAMNPVDHPHGGQTSGGMTPVTPWGIPTRGKSTKKIK